MKMMNGVAIDHDEHGELPDDIENVKKRLQLLYPGNHELKLYKEEEINVSLLKISLIKRSAFVESDREKDFYAQGPNYSYANT